MSASSTAQGSAADRFARLRGLLSADPSNARLRRDCLQAALAAGEHEFVRSDAEQRLAANPVDAEALFDRANALIGARQFADALAVLDEVDRIQPGIGAVMVNRALCHYALDDYAQAHAAAKACYDAGDRSAAVLRLLVSSGHHLGRYDEAVGFAEANTAAAEADGPLAGTYAVLYMDEGNERQCARWAATALRLNPDSIDGLLVQATLRTGQLDTAGARAQFEQVLARAPELGRAWIGLGALALQEQDFEGAKRLLRQGLQFMPEHVGSWHMLGWVHLITRELDDAQRVFEHALALDRNFAESHGGLACVAALRGDREAAERLIRVAQRLDPKGLSAAYARSVLAGLAGDQAGASQIILDTVTRLSPRDGGMLSQVVRKITGR